MSEQTVHDIKNVLHRLELMSELLVKKDFSTFSEAEIREDVKTDLAKLQKLFAAISTGR